MRIVVMGTGPFAVPSLQALARSEQDVVALVTRPSPSPRSGKKAPINPMRDVAQALGLPILEPPNINDESARPTLVDLRADLYVVCDYGQILSAATLATSRLGGINLHGSILPKYRGAAPVNWALLNGDLTTGVTVIHMTPKLDGGPRLTWRETAIEPEESAVELEQRLALLGVEPVLEAIQLLQDWDGESVLGTLQRAGEVSKAPRLSKNDGQIDWTWEAKHVANHVRAMKPWPGSFVILAGVGKKTPLRIILTRVSIVDQPPASGQPGQVILNDGKQLFIRAGDGKAISVDEIQPAGKRLMKIAEFLRGHRVEVGDIFGSLVTEGRS